MEINELNKLTNKYYLLEENERIYCSKCGERVLKDTYQFLQHEKKCNIKFENRISASKNKEVFRFAFKILEDNLVFFVYCLKLDKINGKSNKYSGSKWHIVFKATFNRDDKHVEEKGLYNVDIWFKKMIDIDGMKCLNKYDYIKVINEYFPSIKEIYNLGMFLDIYREKRYQTNNINIDNLKDISREKINLDIFEKNVRYSYSSDENFYCFCKALKINNDVILECSIYKISILNEFLDLTQKNINFKEPEPYYHLYIGKDFIQSDKDVSYNDIMNKIYDFKFTDLELFINKYPELMIENYLNNGGKNIFNSILGPNYNKCIEITAKAGLSHITDNLDLIKENIDFHSNNLKDIFKIPVKALRCLNSFSGIEFLMKDGFLDACSRAYKLQTAIFNDILNISQLAFISAYFGEDNEFDFIPKKQVLKIIRYLGKDNFSKNRMEYFYYKDYLEMCDRYDEFVDDICPKDIILSHNNIVKIIEINADEVLVKSFVKAVSKYKYARLASSFIEENEEKPVIESDYFEIIVPESHIDLINESNELGHCVKTYINKVADRITYILFLRNKKDITKPLATIEVLTDYRLIQLKAKFNMRADKNAQNYVKKWAKAKGITIASYDID